jgi:hypothetical protein
MPNRVRIEGDPDIYEVICETELVKVLVNRAAKHRREIAHFQSQIIEASERLAEAQLANPEAPADAADVL